LEFIIEAASRNETRAEGAKASRCLHSGRYVNQNVLYSERDANKKGGLSRLFINL